MPSTDTKTVRQYGLRKLSNLRLPPVGTATGGDTTSVIDTAASLTGATANHFDGLWIKIATDGGGGGAAPEGEVRAVAAAGYSASGGDFTTAAYTAGVASGDTYELHKYAHPDEWDEIVKEKVRKLHMPTFFPLSLQLVTNDDNDFEDSATNNYTATNTTLTKGTAAGLIRRGAQYGISTLSSSVGYITPGNFNVFEGEIFHTAANAAVGSAGHLARLIAYDMTGAANIEVSTSGALAWTELYYQFGVPTDSRIIQMRLAGVGSSDVINWDDFQIWGGSREVYRLPSWITREEQVEGIRAFPHGTGGPAADNDYRLDERRSYALDWGFEYEDVRAANELFVWVEGTSDRPYILARRTLPEPTSDTSTINFEPDLLAEGVLAEMAARLANNREIPDSERSRFASIAHAAKNQWAGGLRKLGLLDPIEHKRSNRVWVS